MPRPWGETRQEVKARLRWPEWGWRAESSWLAFPFLHEPELSSLTVVHLVRHPKLVIDSKCRMGFWNGKHYRTYANWARSYLPLLDQWQTIQDKAAYWYIEVNRRVAKRADFFHRVEDDVRPLLDRLDIQYNESELYTNTRYNSRSGYHPSNVKLVNFSVPLRLELMQLSKQYGYRWRDDH